MRASSSAASRTSAARRADASSTSWRSAEASRSAADMTSWIRAARDAVTSSDEPMGPADASNGIGRPPGAESCSGTGARGAPCGRHRVARRDLDERVALGAEDGRQTGVAAGVGARVAAGHEVARARAPGDQQVLDLAPRVGVDLAPLRVALVDAVQELLRAPAEQHHAEGLGVVGEDRVAAVDVLLDVVGHLRLGLDAHHEAAPGGLALLVVAGLDRPDEGLLLVLERVVLHPAP